MGETEQRSPRSQMSRGKRAWMFLRVLRRKPLALFAILGPGVIAGASDVDPTSVASLAVIGSTTQYDLAWLVILVIPMLIIVQTISATVGVVARTGLEDAVRTRYGRGWAMVALLCVVVINIITLGADLEGGANAMGLLTGLPYQWFVAPLGIGAAVLLVWGSYSGMQRVLRWAMLIFVAYILAALFARPNWGDVLTHTITPTVSFTSSYLSGAIALLGTTLTSYAYVWETIEEGAERPPLRRLGLVQVDAGIGMAVSGILFWSIVVTTGATLGAHHHPVQTAQDAAHALAPVAGQFAGIIFGLGLLASAILAIPILAGTSAYVLAEAFGWRRSLDTSFVHAPKFYIALLLSLTAGLGLTFLGLAPIQLLFLSSIFGGLATPVTLTLMLLIARDRSIMGERRISRTMAIAGYAVMAVVILASLAFLLQTFLPRH